MLEDDKVTQNEETPRDEAAESAAPVVKKTTRKAAAKRTTKKAAAAEETPAAGAEAEAPAAPRKRAAAKRTTKKAAAPSAETPPQDTAAQETAAPETAAQDTAPDDGAAALETAAPVVKKTARKSTTRRTAKKTPPAEVPPAAEPAEAAETAAPGPAVLFQPPAVTTAPRRRTRKKAEPAPEAGTEPTEDEPAATEEPVEEAPVENAEEAPTEDTDSETPESEDSEDSDEDSDSDSEGGPTRRRRRRGGRRRRKSGDGGASTDDSQDEAAPEGSGKGSGEAEESTDDGAESGSEGTSRRRRRRRRSGEEGDSDDEPNTVTRVRKQRSAEDQITAVSGSTRLEAKKQRRREGREAGRRRAPIVSEAEFLARRESVERVMVIRQREDLTQIAVLEDKVLVEHYVARESQTSIIGNVYLGRVQNVLPSMEAAFIDIGKGRNAVLYAGEVNWSALGHKEGQPRKIESVLQSGQTILVQVTKDPVGHKGARLTSQVSLAGRFLVYVPDGTTSGISRKLPDTERNRLKTLLKEIVPDTAGVIVRTAAEGASEDELTRDVERLKARWEDIEKKAKGKGSGVQLLYGEPDLTLKVVRDLFTEDFTKLVIEGDDAWETVQGYVAHVAPDLQDRLERFERQDGDKDVFGAYRIEEQIQKGLDRKVWLPSGGSLVIDRTEAMTVVDVNTGKFTGSGGNLEETVTKNNLEAAEEIVRQLRLRDIGGIIVVDFIDMVLESNRDLVVRRLVECLGRDRTRHQVAEVTSLGLVQMTRKRIGTGLLESFSENCEHCQGRGVVIKDSPVEPSRSDDDGGRRGGNGGNGNRRGRGRKGPGSGNDAPAPQSEPAAPSPAEVAAMARREKAAEDKPAEEKAPEDRAPKDRAPKGRAPEDSAPEAPTQQETPESKSQSRTQDETPAVEPESPADSGPSQPAPTKVVSRTRRKAASRPAGPPANPSPAPVVQDQPVVAAPAAAETAEIVVTHVPIKKRGTRKR